MVLEGENEEGLPKIMFFNYEEVIKDPTKNVIELAEFLDCPFSR